MIRLVNNIFLNNNFNILDIQWENTNTKTYINEKSETYILYFIDEISGDIPDEVFNFCADEVYLTDKLTQAQKSNLSIIIVCKINHRLSDIEKKIIYRIEESDLYYKKFFLWYSQEELSDLMKMIGNECTAAVLNTILTNKDLFNMFKKNQNDNTGYALLSRIYIKIQFLTLNELDTLDKTLFEYFQDELNMINKQLLEYISAHHEEKQLIDKSIDLVELEQNELQLIDKQLREVVDMNELQ